MWSRFRSFFFRLLVVVVRLVLAVILVPLVIGAVIFTGVLCGIAFGLWPFIKMWQ